MKQKYSMYKGSVGFMDYVGEYDCEDVSELDHKIMSGENDYYCLVDPRFHQKEK